MGRKLAYLVPNASATLTRSSHEAEALLSALLDRADYENGTLFFSPDRDLMDALCAWGSDHAEHEDDFDGEHSFTNH